MPNNKDLQTIQAIDKIIHTYEPQYIQNVIPRIINIIEKAGYAKQ